MTTYYVRGVRLGRANPRLTVVTVNTPHHGGWGGESGDGVCQSNIPASPCSLSLLAECDHLTPSRSCTQYVVQTGSSRPDRVESTLHGDGVTAGQMFSFWHSACYFVNKARNRSTFPLSNQTGGLELDSQCQSDIQLTSEILLRIIFLPDTIYVMETSCKSSACPEEETEPYEECTDHYKEPRPEELSLLGNSLRHLTVGMIKLYGFFLMNKWYQVHGVLKVPRTLLIALLILTFRLLQMIILPRSRHVISRLASLPAVLIRLR